MKKFFTLIAVAVMAFAAQAATLTVCEGTEVSYYLPVYGFWTDTEGTLGQTIYTADMLSGMKDGKISQVKYTTNSEGVGFQNVTLQLSFKAVEQDGFEYGQTITDATPVATAAPAKGDTEIVFDLTEPYEYKGGNLLIECKVIVAGTWGSTFFYGIKVAEGYPSYYKAISGYRDQFMPMVVFTYEEGSVTPPTPPTPTEETAAPTFNGYTTDGIHAYFVQINPTEPSTIYYRVQFPDGTWTEWAEYEDILSFTGNGKYRVEAYAVAPNKLPSTEIAYEFVVSPFTGIDEMIADKAVANVRYFNMAGQEMQQVDGLTIMVTTYTDGTTSAVKVVK